MAIQLDVCGTFDRIFQTDPSPTPIPSPSATSSAISASEALPVIVVGPEFEHDLTAHERQVIADSLSIAIEDVPDFDNGAKLFEGRNSGVQLIANIDWSRIYTFTFTIPPDASDAFKPIDPDRPIKFFGEVCPRFVECEGPGFQDITDYLLQCTPELTGGKDDLPLAMSLCVSVPSDALLYVMVIAYYADNTPQ